MVMDRYIDFLIFTHKQDTGAIEYIPQWHKEIVSQRVSNAKKPVDAFDMLDDLENE